MSGLAPKLPISRDKSDGIKLIKKYSELASQNLKMLVLTVPGERMMDPEFGVGARRYLFEQMNQATFDSFKSRLLTQQQKFLPDLTIKDVKFISALSNPEMDENYLAIRIIFFNKVLKSSDSLLLPITA